jgi:hypothetical protein
MDDTSIMKLSSVGYLRLAYVATEITLHRRIILALSPSTDPRLQQICRSVAHERFMFAIDFVQALKPQHLSSFWYFASPQNFALIGVFGTLLVSTASNPQEADFYRTKLREYRWTLKINSENGAKYMKPAMALLDANMALLTEANNPSPITKDEYKNGNGANIVPTVSINPDQYHFSDGLSTGGDFTSPGQYTFDTPYYPVQNSTTTSPVTYQGISEAQSQSFDFGIEGNSALWNY